MTNDQHIYVKMPKKTWRTIQKSGAYKAQLKKNRAKLLASLLGAGVSRCNAIVGTSQCDLDDISSSESESDTESDTEFENDGYSPDELDPDDVEQDDLNAFQANNNNIDESWNWNSYFQEWALEHNIRHSALSSLLHTFREHGNKLSSIIQVPIDARTVMKTPKHHFVYEDIDGGSYWHAGFENCIRSYFADLDRSIEINININIDGLPIFNSGPDQFWPILFNIYGMPEFQPMVIGLFYGQEKPHKVEQYLKPFVDEINPILENGIIIGEYVIKVHIRSFICDSPARSFLKGISSKYIIFMIIECPAKMYNRIKFEQKKIIIFFIKIFNILFEALQTSMVNTDA